MHKAMPLLLMTYSTSHVHLLDKPQLCFECRTRVLPAMKPTGYLLPALEPVPHTNGFSFCLDLSTKIFHVM